MIGAGLMLEDSRARFGFILGNLLICIQLSCGECDLLPRLEGWHAEVRARRAPERVAEVA